jgi:hypothetical protein
MPAPEAMEAGAVDSGIINMEDEDDLSDQVPEAGF